MNKQILLVGPFPPPLGGISVHNQRLHQLLENESFKVTKVSTHNPNRNRLLNIFELLKQINRYKGNLIHLHVSAFESFVFVIPFIWLILMCKKDKKLVVTIHSGRFLSVYNKFSSINKLIISFFLKKTNHVIAVSSELKFFLMEEIGIPETKISVIPAFLPPDKNANDSDLRKVIDKRKKNVVIAGALKELYGFDVVIKAIKTDSNLLNLYNFIFVFYMDSDPDYAKQILNDCNKLGIHFFREMDSKDFISLLNLSDVFLRPTTTDGDSVAVREAIYLGKCVIASDSVERPDRVHTFKTSDPVSLINVMYNVLNKQEEKNIHDFNQNIKSIIKVYKKLNI